MPLLSNSRKNRLYMSFYVRSSKIDQFHTGLTLTPKNPSAGKLETWRYHVKNVIDPITKTEIWKYEGVLVPNTVVEMAACVFLGKLSSDVTSESINDLLERVPLKQDDKTWRCHDWVWDAVKALVDESILTNPNVNAQQIWQTGRKFAEGAGYATVAVPVCDVNGNGIHSELRRS
ncbi:hypothetical protein BJ138DRAFT_1114353 [Hygrophoropsis aurantiaca]|uniref:Uncharacterized protein n=1 Tax=Hygrophoropsis aurantiaca TaxID=72124 RepID=A0ACB8AAP7_9AGAM|nr:hypothetical protein BJ138DRAFT_1114353 [Hygrophoropsis aurantiaca]